MDAGWLPDKPGALDRAAQTADIKEFRARLGRRLTDHKFEHRRTYWVRTYPDVTWVVQVERVFTGPRIAIRLGIYVPAVASSQLSMNACDVHLDWDAAGTNAPPSAAGHRHSERGAYLGVALDFSTAIEMNERLAVADFAAAEIIALTEQATDLPSLSGLVIGTPGRRHMLVSKRLRDAISALA